MIVQRVPGVELTWDVVFHGGFCFVDLHTLVGSCDRGLGEIHSVGPVDHSSFEGAAAQ